MVNCVPEARLHALYEVDQQWIGSLKKQIRLLEFEKAKIIHAMFGRQELNILGKPVSIEVTWPEGRPYGLSDEDICGMIPVPELPS